ncbi:hypothetical protein KSP40_PGU018793 [Platanthera guangdongensis]|uniref:AAA+ ATPase domain-containing protein n=1 Tax=Platanthera guangdongensis TaxID=2320717 RepID=A0ABR2M4C3_9ASPA
MTRAIHHDLPKDESHSVGSVGVKGEYGAINQHLRNHIHLTNCIHLKNHMHRHSPVQSEKSLMRDLVVLQRSKSLRDPSTSPPSWLSPFVISTLVKESGEDAGVHSGRRSIGVDIGREVARLPVCYPKAPGAAGTVEDHSAGKEYRDDEIRKGEDCSRLSVGEKTSHPNLLGKNSRLKTLSEQLEEIPSQTNNEIRTHRYLQSGQRRGDERSSELNLSGLARYNGFSRKKRRKFRSARRTQGSAESKSGRVHNDISVASTSFTQGFMNHRCSLRKEGEEEEKEDVDVTQAPRHGCGIPWNWSRIHHRGKTFLDIAGRSLSCGLSDSRLKKDEESVQQSKKDKSKMPISSQQLTSSTGSDSESLPFLLDPSGSPESNLNRGMPTACSGELGLYADNNGREIHSDLVFEARSANKPDSRGYFQGRHQSLTQKYTPKTFKDLVGQSLVVQALTNAVLRRKVGLIYVFYGPHGTGKTSCARVFAKSLNCQSTELPKPCDMCTSCISHNLGKSRYLLEVGAVSSFDNGKIIDALNDAILSAPTSQYRVFIIDDCDILPSDTWMAISKWISTSEGLDIDKDALKLIASRSDGSLRDAEMTLDQLSLLGERVSLALVQELVGLVSDEKLVDLLDVALSADTVNTIKSLREITEAGVEPLSLMSQLATVITDILAGSYIFTRERLRRNFFRRPTLSKEDMEKLRQALRTLSESEKNLRLSTDKLTWLTAALLQIVPDQQYVMPSSLTDTNYNQIPLLINSIDERLVVGNTGNEVVEEFYSNGELNRNIGLGCRKELVVKNSMHVNRKIDNNNNISGKEPFKFARNGKEPLGNTQKAIWSAEEKSSYKLGRSCKGYEKLWREVIENIQSDALKLFLSQEGRLESVCLGSDDDSPLCRRREKAEGLWNGTEGGWI